jgi:hypothetical protein
MCWAPKSAECKFCTETIITNTPEVVVIFTSDKHTTKKYYHPTCWIQSGLNNLQAKPYIPESRKVVLTLKQKEDRNTILRRYASLRQRQRKLSKAGLHYEILYANIEAQIAQLMLDVLPLGGVPKKWANNG